MRWATIFPSFAGSIVTGYALLFSSLSSRIVFGHKLHDATSRGRRATHDTASGCADKQKTCRGATVVQRQLGRECDKQEAQEEKQGPEDQCQQPPEGVHEVRQARFLFPFKVLNYLAVLLNFEIDQHPTIRADRSGK